MSAVVAGVERVTGVSWSRFAPLLPVTLIVAARALADGGIVPVSVGPLTVNVLLGLAAAGYGGILLLARRRLVWWFVGLLVVTAIWAGIGTPEFGLVPWMEWLRFAGVLGVAAAVLNLKDRVDHVTAALAIELIVLVPAIAACLQFFTGTGMNVQGDIRAVGTLAHPNTAGLLLAIGLFCAVIRIVESRRSWDIALVVLFLVALVGTESFGSFAAALAMVLVYLLVSPRFSARFRIVTAVVAVVVPVIVALSPLGADRLAGLFQPPGDRGSAVDSISWRFETWVNLWTVFQQSPWIGRGLGATTAATIVENNLPHNEYMRALVELGWIGAIPLLVACIVGAVVLVRRRREGNAPAAASVALALIAGLAVNAFVANTVLYTVPMLAAALLLGGCLSALSREKTALP